jgi:START domain
VASLKQTGFELIPEDGGEGEGTVVEDDLSDAIEEQAAQTAPPKP